MDTFIECLICGAVSFNEMDIKEHYCGRCHLFLTKDEYEVHSAVGDLPLEKDIE